MAFVGRVALVTGSTSGIGQATALLLAQRGARVIVHGQSNAHLEKTRRLLAESGVDAGSYHVVMGDICDARVQTQLVDETISKYGCLDILVNNAGVASKRNTKPTDVATLDHVWQINFRSVWTLTQLALPHLRKERGNIVNVSSIGATTPVVSVPGYNISKAALEHFTRHAAVLYARDGIRVNTVSPGPCVTNIGHSYGIRDEEEWTRANASYVCSHNPMRRLGSACEVAEVIAFVASERAAFITGSTLAVDGGQSAGVPVPLKAAKKDAAAKKAAASKVA